MCVFSENDLSGDSGYYPVDFAPQDGSSDERLTNVIFEKNWLHYGTATYRAINISARKVTIRNNIIDLSIVNTGGDNEGVRIEQLGIEPAPDQVWVYNNVVYSSSSAALNNGGTYNYVGVLINDGTNIVVRNNVGWFPNSPNADVMISNGVGANATLSNNTADGSLHTGTSPFVSSSPTVPADYQIGTGSAAYNAGYAAPVFDDLFRNFRDHAQALDMGVSEQGASEWNPGGAGGAPLHMREYARMRA